MGNPGFGREPAACTLADVDVDGILDLVVANFKTHDITVLLGRGDGSFSNGRLYSTRDFSGAGQQPRELAIADIDGDGFLDVVTANKSGSVSFLRGRPGGEFVLGKVIPTGSGTQPSDVVAADVTGDGTLDLATSNKGSNDVSILRGLGAGFFSRPERFGLGGGQGPSALVVGSFNGDGLPDLATSNDASDNVTRLLGTADGLSAPAVFAVGTAPRDIAAADVTGDRRVDLVTADFYSDTVTILRGTGAGSFEFHTQLGTGFFTSPEALALADLNLDRVVDIVTANFNTDDITVLLGSANGSFPLRQRFAVDGDGPVAIAVGDLNSDELPDVVTVNQNDGSVTVLLQQ